MARRPENLTRDYRMVGYTRDGTQRLITLGYSHQHTISLARDCLGDPEQVEGLRDVVRFEVEAWYGDEWLGAWRFIAKWRPLAQWRSEGNPARKAVTA
jgi:hypothetical protein